MAKVRTLDHLAGPCDKGGPVRVTQRRIRDCHRSVSLRDKVIAGQESGLCKTRWLPDHKESDALSIRHGTVRPAQILTKTAIPSILGPSLGQDGKKVLHLATRAPCFAQDLRHRRSTPTLTPEYKPTLPQ
jgi:hypothetical protein